MRNTLKNNAGLSRSRITDYSNCKPMQIFKMIRHLVEMNDGHASVIYQDGYPNVILPISRICEKYINSIPVEYNHSYKLNKYIKMFGKRKFSIPALGDLNDVYDLHTESYRRRKRATTMSSLYKYRSMCVYH